MSLNETTPSPQRKVFHLNYAPHFGMFQNHAGSDPVDQLKFAADEGFRAWEDNGMKGRSPQEQEKIARAMGDLGITMGVFVANTIDWTNPTLTTGRKTTWSGSSRTFGTRSKSRSGSTRSG